MQRLCKPHKTLNKADEKMSNIRKRLLIGTTLFTSSENN